MQEVFDQMKTQIDAVVVPVGGGGLLSGSLLTTKLTNSNIKVILIN
jgi:threonine dehydratase